MQGLKQIQVVTQGDAWHLIGLDEQGRLWFGTIRRTTKGRAVTWTPIDETAEDEAPPPTSAGPPPEEGRRRWPSRPSA
jgi:hypothetical protein